MTNDPKLAAELRIPDQAATWQPQTARNDGTGAVGRDHSGGFSRAIMQDGNIVGTETGRTSQSSVDAIAREANGAANTPYSRAVDGRTAQPLAPHELKEDSVLTYPAGQVTAAQARALGWLQPATSAQPQNTQGLSPLPFDASQEAPKAEEHPDLQSEGFKDPEVEQTLNSLIEVTAGADQFEAIRQVIDNGEIDARTLGTLASQAGVEPGQLAQDLAPVIQAFETQARATMSAGGLEADDVIAFAQQHRSDKLNFAMHNQATKRSTEGYRALRQDYLESLAEYKPEMALAADLGPGNAVYKDASGKIIVRLASGATMLWKNAIQAFGPK
jgi:hypothetical protein